MTNKRSNALERLVKTIFTGGVGGGGVKPVSWRQPHP